MENYLVSFDLSVLQFFYLLRSPLLTVFFINITNLGGTVLVWLGAFIIFFLLVKKYYKEALLFSCTTGGSVILNSLLKNFFHRSRPQLHPLILENNYSFPSGHAMNSFVFYIMLSYLIFCLTENKKVSIKIAFSSIVLVELIGLSRIYLGVHYPTDVLGGYIIGFLWMRAALFLYGRLCYIYVLIKKRFMASKRNRK